MKKPAKTKKPGNRSKFVVLMDSPVMGNLLDHRQFDFTKPVYTCGIGAIVQLKSDAEMQELNRRLRVLRDSQSD